MSKVFFVSYGGGHANIIKHIYKKLEQLNEFDLSILALTASVKIYDKAGISYKTYVDYLKLIDHGDKIKEVGENLAKSGYDETSEIPYEQIAAYLGVGYYDCLMENNMDNELTQQEYKTFGRKMFCPIHTMSQIMHYEKPDVVVLTCGVRSEKAAGIVANQMGIPVVRIVDLINIEAAAYNATLCVMNQKVKDILSNRDDWKHNPIIVTGQPVFEHNLRLNQEKISLTEDYINKKKFKNVIIYLESPGYKDQEVLEPEICRLAKKSPQNLYIIKLHPNQKPLKIEQKPQNVRIEQKYELKYLLNSCDVAITGASTSGLEAAFLDKPLIVTDVCCNKKSSWSDYGIAIKVTKTEDLENAINICLDKGSPTAKAFEEGRKKFNNSGNATENIVCVIKNVIK